MSPEKEPQVLVVGAGPVGLAAALFLARAGISVRIIDRDQRTSQHSYALALHPSTLRLLPEVGLADAVLAPGRALARIAFYDESARRAEVDYTRLPGHDPQLLVLRQSALERAMEGELSRRHVKIGWNHALRALDTTKTRPSAEIAELDQVAAGYPVARLEWVTVRTTRVEPEYVIGADGYDSAVRRMSGINTEDLGGRQVFSVYELDAEGELPDEVRVVLGRKFASVYWPLEKGRCRWGFEIRDADDHDAGMARLEALVTERAAWFHARPKAVTWSTVAIFDRKLAKTFGRGRVWLTGDAAHLSLPVGVHSMNVGIREARDVAAAIAAALKPGGPGTGLVEFDAAAREEWRTLLLHGKGVRAGAGADPWVRENASRILPCIPASGADLEALLGQIGLSLE